MENKKIYGKIAIFKVNNKKKETYPDYNGEITIEQDMKPGKYSVGIYINEARSGLKYQGGKITDSWKKPEKEENKEPETYQEKDDDDLDDLPF
jgi:hypothetical protein